MKKKKLRWICVGLGIALLLGGCGQGSSKDGTEQVVLESENYEDDFLWHENIIMGLSESGQKKTKIVIPERCEGFDCFLLSDEGNCVEEVIFESDKDIDLRGAFSGATSLKKITLPKQLTAIGPMDFDHCYSLESISIPATVESIGEYAFNESTALTSVIFEGNAVKTIGWHAFEECTSLSEIALPDSVEMIDDYAFYNCPSLETVRIPASIKSLNHFTFANSGIKEMYMEDIQGFEEYDDTAIVRGEHAMTIFVIKDSYLDQNFDTYFDSSFEKAYWDGK